MEAIDPLALVAISPLILFLFFWLRADPSCETDEQRQWREDDIDRQRMFDEVERSFWKHAGERFRRGEPAFPPPNSPDGSA